MLSYVYFGADDLAHAPRFYDAVLAPLGMQRCVTGDAGWDRNASGWGLCEGNGLRELAFRVGAPFDGRAARRGTGSTVALRPQDWGQVRPPTSPRSLTGAAARVQRVCGRSTTRTSMPPMCVTRTATRWQWDARGHLSATGG